MNIYALYGNGEFVVAKPFYTEPTAPSDFGVGAIPTSTYKISYVTNIECFGHLYIPATIEV